MLLKQALEVLIGDVCSLWTEPIKLLPPVNGLYAKLGYLSSHHLCFPVQNALSGLSPLLKNAWKRAIFRYPHWNRTTQLCVHGFGLEGLMRQSEQILNYSSSS